jgi:RNA recognition motif-containing protein
MNIYISNLSFDVNDSDLKELFEEFGKVSSAKVIMDRMSGKSRGFGFVEMDDNAEGKKAIEELDQVEYDGKVITVSVAKPKTDRPGGNSNSNRRGGGGGSSRFNSERRSNYRE